MIPEDLAAYVRAVMYDGRYLDTFANEPRMIARELGLELSDVSVKTLERERQVDILANVLAGMRDAHAHAVISKVLGRSRT